MTSYKNKTPTDINEMSIEDVLKYLDGAMGDADVASPIVRLKLTQMLYDVLGMTLTPDIALATVAEPPASLVLATAGGGKTTWAQIKAILQKIMRKSKLHPGKKIKGSAILCLVYNKHNVKDMADKHKQMVARLRARNIKGLDIDDEINACTLHSFCDFWRREYVAKMDLLGATLLEQSQAENFMRRAVKIACKKLGNEKLANEIDSGDAFGLYMYYRETMCQNVNDLTESDKFIDLGQPVEVIEAIFNQYDRSKRISHKYDFVDMLFKFYCLLRDDEKVRTRVQKFYEYVIADEVQDFTPLMWAILQLLVSDGTPLTCIGDEDQNIYAFRGADIYNTLNFATMFAGGMIYSLEYNRRCKERILDEARNIIEMNTLRFNKKLRNTKEGGMVKYESYNSMNGQFVNVLKLLKSMNAQELDKTCICYREGVSATILSDMLMSEDIIFNVISGVGPFSHELYKHLFEIFNALEMPYDIANCTTLYKVLPCNKEEFHKAIGYDASKGRFTKEVTRGIHFKDYDYGDLKNRKSFMATIDELATLSSMIETKSVGELITPIFTLMNKYFWGFKKSCNRFPDVDEIMQARVLKYFQSSLIYSKFYQEFQHKRSCYKHYTENREGVTISTFHSLKGLEFENVIVVCMDDALFPNFYKIDSKPYNDKTKQSLKEAEVRLWYVAVTRAISNLYVFYSKDNPSLFVRFALDNNFPVAGKFKDGSDVFKASQYTQDNQALLDTLDDVMSAETITRAQVEKPQKIDIDDTSFDTEPDILEDLDELDEELSQETGTFEEVNDNAFDDATEGQTLAAQMSTSQQAYTSNNSVVWESTEKLVNDAASTDDTISSADTEQDTKQETEHNEEDADEAAITLKSGKSLYLNKLLNSI